MLPGLGLVAWPLAAPAMARALIADRPLARADALVVLAGSRAYERRAVAAARLFLEGAAPRILLTNDGLRGGWSSAQQRNPLFVERARDALIGRGVPADKIEILPAVVRGTHDEAIVLERYSAERPVRSLLLVTSAYHSRRALRTVRRQLRAEQVAVGMHALPPRISPATWWLSPAGWRLVGMELVKLAYYRARWG